MQVWVAKGRAIAWRLKSVTIFKQPMPPCWQHVCWCLVVLGYRRDAGCSCLDNHCRCLALVLAWHSVYQGACFGACLKNVFYIFPPLLESTDGAIVSMQSLNIFKEYADALVCLLSVIAWSHNVFLIQSKMSKHFERRIAMHSVLLPYSYTASKHFIDLYDLRTIKWVSKCLKLYVDVGLLYRFATPHFKHFHYDLVMHPWNVLACSWQETHIWCLEKLNQT